MGFLSRFSRDEFDDTEFEDEFDLSNAALKRSHSVGALLRQARQGFGREVGQIGAALRIRSSHLQAIEDGRYEDLPGGTYAIGFIRTYAEYLGLDGPEMVRRFKQELEGQEFKNDLSFPMPVGERRIPGGTMLLGGAIIALCGYGIWHYASSGDRGRTEQVAAVPSALLAPPSDGASPPPADAAASSSTAMVTPGSAAAAAPALVPATPPLPPQTASESAVSQAIFLAQAQARTPASPPQARGLPPPAPDSQMASVPTPAAATQAAPPPGDPPPLCGETNGAYRIALPATPDCWLEGRDAD